MEGTLGATKEGDMEEDQASASAANLSVASVSAVDTSHASAVSLAAALLEQHEQEMEQFRRSMSEFRCVSLSIHTPTHSND